MARVRPLAARSPRRWRGRLGAGLRAAVGSLGLFLAACSDHTPPVEADERLPLPALALPQLSCALPVTPAGSCARAADCDQSLGCVLASDTAVEDGAPPALRCAEPVGTLAERERCDAGERCESGLCALAGVCLAPCRESGDCARGQVCQPVQARIAGGLVPLMACTRGAAFPGDVELLRSGPVDPLVPDQISTVSSPASAPQALLFLRVACDVSPLVVSLHSRESGQALFELEGVLNGERPLNPVFTAGNGALVPVLVPNNPGVTPSARGYDIGVSTADATGAELLVAARDGNGTTLDLNLFYVGGGATEQAGGFHPGAAGAAKVVSELGMRLEELGIELGALREYDVQGVTRAALSVLKLEEIRDDDGNLIDQRLRGLEQLFELSAGVDDTGVNVFFVSDMGPVLGISGGVPGALGIHGTSASGVAVALDVAGLERAPQVLAHELAHQLGLFHTSEQSGVVLEPLADTPECRPDRDLDGDGRVEVSECQGLGVDNLMFWAGLGRAVSAQQKAVLRASLVLR
jgi:hypothetical protein